MPAGLGSPRAKSRVLAALEQRASRLGTDVHGLLKEDRRLLRTSKYPGPDCLHPHEVEQFCAIELPESRLSHVESCPMCAALLDIAIPTDTKFDSLMKARHTVLPEKIWNPVINVALIQACLVAAAAAVVVWALWKDTVFFIALSPVLVRSIVLTLLGSVVLCLLVLAAEKILAPSYRQWIVRYSAPVASGAFVLFIAICTVGLSPRVFSNYNEVIAAQRSLVERMATLGNGPLTEVFSQKVLGGKVIVQPQTRGIAGMYFDSSSGETSRNIGTIYSGLVTSVDSSGEVQIVTPDQKKVEFDSSSKETRQGQHVLALVPKRSASISVIYPTTASAVFNPPNQ
jgi:hypothetical protein